MLKMYQVGEEHAPPSQIVAIPDTELHRWRSPCPSTATDYLLLDTRSQKLLELGEAGFYASSSHRLQPFWLSDFASDLQLT